MRHIMIACACCGIAFLLLLAFRTGFFEKASTSMMIATPPDVLADREAWMNVFQNDRKIGYSHSVLAQTENGYLLREELSIRINTMGVSQEVEMSTRAGFLADMSLDRFDFTIGSGPFHFSAAGKITEHGISVTAESDGVSREIQIPVTEKPSLAAVLIPVVAAKNPRPGDSFSFSVFDPTGMGSQAVTVDVAGAEIIQFQGRPESTHKMLINYQGMIQTAWVDQNGNVLREEGLLGLRLEKTTRQDALSGIPVETGRDVTEEAAVSTNRHIENPARLKSLAVRINGIDPKGPGLDGGRQTLSGRLLHIRKESLDDLPVRIPEHLPVEIQSQLAPTLFIQSDHPRIQQLAGEITAPDDALLIKIKKIMAWIERHIEKRPVLSLPDAIATLDNRRGDCNEHAILFAAIARAAGIPTRVEAGLVYLRERFYYHAWNSVFVGRWITVDPLFGQFPADVTHLRFAIGEQNFQTALISPIGRITITVEALDESDGNVSSGLQEE